MRVTFFLLAVVVVFIVELAVAQATIPIQKSSSDFKPLVDDNTARYLKGSNIIFKQDVEEEERGVIPPGAIAKLKGYFRSNSDKHPELTEKKLKKIETYAKENPTKWAKLTYYLSHFYNLSWGLFVVGGMTFFGWSFYGAGRSS